MRLATALAFSVVLAAPAVGAQQMTPPMTTPGPISRITLFRVKPGQGDAFWNDVRTNLKPIYDEYKRQGIVTDYGYFTKQTFENEEDWTVGLSLSGPNWAALDTFGQRTDAVTLRHYGSAERRTQAANARNATRDLVSSFLIRAQTPNPMP